MSLKCSHGRVGEQDSIAALYACVILSDFCLLIEPKPQ